MAVLMLFRNDLRLYDNSALYEAFKTQEEVILLFHQDYGRALGESGKWWLEQSLRSLQDDVSERGGTLYTTENALSCWLPELIKKYGVTDVFCGKRYDPEEVERDQKLEALLAKHEVVLHQFTGFLLTEPAEIKNKQGKDFRVYTPFWKSAITTVNDLVHHNPPRDLSSKNIALDGIKKVSGAPKESAYWQPGEQGARARWKEFLKKYLDQYKKGRDFPALSCTSYLSPHLRFGEVSPHRMLYSLKEYRGVNKQCFISELGWREFAYYCLKQHPDMAKNSINDWFNKVSWSKSKQRLEVWQHGQTGYPIVDAGMRELNETGYMHNRVRMICASFLVKDLALPWQWGEQYFWDKLMDADPASNPMNWQWSAGCGIDAAPYFRVFNPTLQAEKFDPDSEYVDRWAPDSAELGQMIDHGKARDEILAKFKKAKGSK